MKKIEPTVTRSLRASPDFKPGVMASKTLPLTRNSKSQSARRGFLSREEDQTMMRVRLLKDIRHSRQSSEAIESRPCETSRGRSLASRLADKFEDFVNSGRDLMTSEMPTRSLSPVQRKLHLSYLSRSPQMSIDFNSPLQVKRRAKMPKQSIQSSVVTDYRLQQKRSLKLLRFTVPRSLMTKRQQLQLFGKVSGAYMRVRGVVGN